MNALVATQVPPSRKVSALGVIFSFFHCGNLVGLALSPLIILHYGWPQLFIIFGAFGLPLLLLWHSVMPPPAVVTLAGSQSGGVPQPSVRELLSERATVAIAVANFVNHWGYFIFLSWIPAYFANVFGLDLKASALMAWLPWCAMALGSSWAGLLSDALVKRWPVLLCLLLMTVWWYLFTEEFVFVDFEGVALLPPMGFAVAAPRSPEMRTVSPGKLGKPLLNNILTSDHVPL